MHRVLSNEQTFLTASTDIKFVLRRQVASVRHEIALCLVEQLVETFCGRGLNTRKIEQLQKGDRVVIIFQESLVVRVIFLCGKKKKKKIATPSEEESPLLQSSDIFNDLTRPFQSGRYSAMIVFNRVDLYTLSTCNVVL